MNRKTFGETVKYLHRAAGQAAGRFTAGNAASGTAKHIAAVFLAAAMIFTMAVPSNIMPVQAASKTFRDTKGHWAENYISTAADRGIINGYTDNRFKPDSYVTRAELIRMVNGTIGNTLLTENYFSDVRSGDWYYNDVRKAIAAGYISGGNDDGTLHPNDWISRQEAAVIISRVVPTYGYKAKLESYKDYKDIDDWAKPAMEKMVGKGYFGPYDDEKLHPKDCITRAQAAKILCTVYGNENIITSQQTVKSSGTKYKDKIYANGITVASSINNGEFTLENCVVLGKLTLNGGGTNSIKIKNSRVAKCVTDRKAGAIRVLLQNETYINQASAFHNVTMETEKLTGGQFGCGIQHLYVEDDAQVVLDGDFQNVYIDGKNSDTTLTDGTIKKLEVTYSGDYSDITISDDTECDYAVVNAPADFHGSGTIGEMKINSDDVTYETRPLKWSIGSNGTTPDMSDGKLSVKFSPKNGATAVARNTEITLTFSSPLYNEDGKKLGTSDLESGIELRKKSRSGTKLNFSSAINSSKKVVTITPEEKFEEDTRYYVLLEDDTFFDEEGNELPETSCYFTTGDSEDEGITFSPSDDSDGVSLSKKPTITFEEAILTKDGDKVDDEYLEDAIIFREGGSTGTDVKFEASINSAKTKITITPESDLSTDATYYVAIEDDMFIYKNDKSDVEGCSATWTTSVTKASLSSVNANATEDTVTVTATPSIDGTIYAVLVKGSSTPSSSQILAGQNSKGETPEGAASTSATAGVSASVGSFSGLEEGTKYTVYLMLKSDTKTSSIVSKSVTTTKSELSNCYLSGISIENESGAAPDSFTFEQKTTVNDVVMPFGSATATVVATADADATISFKESGGTYETMSGDTKSISLSDDSIVTLYIQPAADGKTSVQYTLRFKVAGDTGATVTVADMSGNDIAASASGGTRFVLDKDNADLETVKVTITANDPDAVITSQTLGGTSGTGSLSGFVTNPGTHPHTGNIILEYTVKSNRDSQKYSVYIILWQ
ncbi:MAG: S-layer homology domain-containing protein [Clostridia bacterium]|nr:S-layer homology domain-containing protein [Clostridia bacterium]